MDKRNHKDTLDHIKLNKVGIYNFIIMNNIDFILSGQCQKLK